MKRLVDTFHALLLASDELEIDAPSAEFLDQIIESEIIRPAENELLGYWYARYLSIRQALWELINECLKTASQLAMASSNDQRWSLFIVGYATACLLIRNDQKFLFTIAKHSLLQRKFNEEFAEFRIPRKQYTAIFSAFTDGRDALRIYDAIRLAKNNKDMIVRSSDDPIIGTVAARIPEFEAWLNPSKRTYFQRLLSYISHKWRRKGVVALNNLLSNTVEKVGRVASELNLPVEKRVAVELRERMLSLLEPGDILLTRHDTALTNLFLPGFWPHAALYVGTEQQRDALGVSIAADTATRWRAQHCVFEALKDGLHFRPISETLAVDNFVVLRTHLQPGEIKKGIERVVRHEGKMYNFNFDFFSSDRLVCSEVVYRAFDGIGDIKFPLRERAGRHTLSPEDLLEFALHDESVSVVGIFGVNEARTEYITGDQAGTIAKSSIKTN